MHCFETRSMERGAGLCPPIRKREFALTPAAPGERGPRVVHRLLIRIIRHRRVNHLCNARMISESDLLQHIEDQPQRAADTSSLSANSPARPATAWSWNLPPPIWWCAANSCWWPATVTPLPQRPSIAIWWSNADHAPGRLRLRPSAGPRSPRASSKRCLHSAFDTGEAMHGDQVLADFHHIHARAGTKAALCA